MTKPNQLRIWHSSNVPNKLFSKEVDSVEEAKMLLNTLADYDLYLGELIQSNAQGLEVYDPQDYGWTEFYDEEDRDIGEIMEEDLNTSKPPNKS